MMTYDEFRKVEGLRRGHKAALAYTMYKLYSKEAE